jgi:anti-anti-sigma factor
MDAHAVGVLAELCATAREAGRTLMLAGASDRVRRLLRLTRLESFLPEFERAMMHTRAPRPSPLAKVSLQ